MSGIKCGIKQFYATATMTSNMSSFKIILGIDCFRRGFFYREEIRMGIYLR